MSENHKFTGTIVVTCLPCVPTGCSNRAGVCRFQKWAQRQAKSGTDEVQLMRHQKDLLAKTLIDCPLLLLWFVEPVLVCALLEWTAHRVQHFVHVQHVLALLVFFRSIICLAAFVACCLLDLWVSAVICT